MCPTRVYVCEKCGNEVELFQKMSEGAPNICEKCGADESMRQVLTASHKLYFGPNRLINDRMK